MKLSAEEEKIIFRKRLQEKLSTPIKVGYLKYDFFSVRDNFFQDKKKYFLKKEIKDFAEKVIFEKSLSKGEEVQCFLTEDGQEFWHLDSRNWMSREWGQTNLINITNLS